MSNTLKRTVYFYDLQVFKSGEKDPLFGMALKLFIDKAFSMDSTNISEGIYIDRYQSDNDYFFGSIGRNKDISTDPLARTRDEKSLKTDKIAPGTKFEYFTFFLINYKTCVVTLLYSPYAPALKQHTCRYLESAQFINIEHARMVTKSIGIKERLSRWKSISKFAIAVPANEIIKYEYPGMNMIKKIGNKDPIGIKVTINISETNVTDDLIDNMLTYDPAGLSKVTVYGSNENALSDNYDLMEKLLTKKSSISLSDDALANRDIVLQELKRQDQSL